MRISQLSSRAGLPVATVKFYLRAGLLHPGLATSATQSLYDETHLARLRLVRALLEIGHLSLADIQRVLDAAGDPETDPSQQRALVRRTMAGPAVAGLDLRAASRIVHDLGWSTPPQSPHLAVLAQVLAGFTSVGVDVEAELPAYAVAAELVARADADTHGSLSNEAAAAAVVLNEALLKALHRLAAEHVDVDRKADLDRVPLPRSATAADRVSS